MWHQVRQLQLQVVLHTTIRSDNPGLYFFIAYYILMPAFVMARQQSSSWAALAMLALFLLPRAVHGLVTPNTNAIINQLQTQTLLYSDATEQNPYGQCSLQRPGAVGMGAEVGEQGRY